MLHSDCEHAAVGFPHEAEPQTTQSETNGWFAHVLPVQKASCPDVLVKTKLRTLKDLLQMTRIWTPTQSNI